VTKEGEGGGVGCWGERVRWAGCEAGGDGRGACDDGRVGNGACDDGWAGCEASWVVWEYMRSAILRRNVRPLVMKIWWAARVGASRRRRVAVSTCAWFVVVQVISMRGPCSCVMRRTFSQGGEKS